MATLYCSPFSSPALAKSELPSLDRCFQAVESELDPSRGVTLKRLHRDVENSNWVDLKQLTREYDASFRGGVLKPIWKQLDGDGRQKGIAFSNSFTFDLIALNKAARNQDSVDAVARLGQVEQDLKDILTLRP